MKKYLYILILIAAIYAPAQSQFAPSRYFRPGQFTEFVKNDTSLSVNVDTLDLFAAMRRMIDSLITARGSGVTVRSEVWLRLYANFSNGSNDSTNLQINVNGVYHAQALPYDVYLDRFVLHTAQPGSKSPATFRDDLPRISTDSAIVFRLSRNASFAAGARAALTAYKVALNSGLSFTNTTGVFYDMVRFDEATFPAAGTSVATVITATLKKNR
jgi:hypothetical protein